MAAPRWIPTGTLYNRIFSHWRAPTGNLRQMLDSVLPVAVVDRFRGPEEGSLRGITGQSLGTVSEFPAVFFGGIPDADGVIRVDIEIHQINVWLDVRVALLMGGVGTPRVVQVNLFTPEAPYNPVVNPNPFGIFIPALNLDPSFTRGRAGMLGGSNPVVGPIGFEMCLQTSQANRSVGFVRNMEAAFVNQEARYAAQRFDPPLRIPAGNGVAIQWLDPGDGIAVTGLTATLLYNERGIL